MKRAIYATIFFKNYSDCQGERDAAKKPKAKAKCQIGHGYRCNKTYKKKNITGTKIKRKKNFKHKKVWYKPPNLLKKNPWDWF